METVINNERGAVVVNNLNKGVGSGDPRVVRAFAQSARAEANSNPTPDNIERVIKFDRLLEKGPRKSREMGCSKMGRLAEIMDSYLGIDRNGVAIDALGNEEEFRAYLSYLEALSHQSIEATNAELAVIFPELIKGIDEYQEDDPGRNDRAMGRIQSIADAIKSHDTFPAVSVRAEQWYELASNRYKSDEYYIDATMKDEPLAPDGRGPLVTGRFVSACWHEVPGLFGNFPGILLADAQVVGAESSEGSFLFIPFGLMTGAKLEVRSAT